MKHETCTIVSRYTFHVYNTKFRFGLDALYVWFGPASWATLVRSLVGMSVTNECHGFESSLWQLFSLFWASCVVFLLCRVTFPCLLSIIILKGFNALGGLQHVCMFLFHLNNLPLFTFYCSYIIYSIFNVYTQWRLKILVSVWVWYVLLRCGMLCC